MEKMIQKLKEALAEARLSAVGRSITHGTCPNALYRIDYNNGCNSEDYVSCEECKRRFMTAMKQQIIQEIEKEFSI